MEKEIINIQVIDREGVKHDLELPTDIGLNLMEACKSYELPVDGTCGGMAMCASCHCYILSDQVEIERRFDEQVMLDDIDDVKINSRLGCQIPITDALDGLTVELAPELINESQAFSDW